MWGKAGGFKDTECEVFWSISVAHFCSIFLYNQSYWFLLILLCRWILSTPCSGLQVSPCLETNRSNRWIRCCACPRMSFSVLACSLTSSANPLMHHTDTFSTRTKQKLMARLDFGCTESHSLDMTSSEPLCFNPPATHRVGVLVSLQRKEGLKKMLWRVIFAEGWKSCKNIQQHATTTSQLTHYVSLWGKMWKFAHS